MPESLNTARGKIEIDITQLVTAQAAVKRASEQMQRALMGAGDAATKAESRWKRFGRTLSSIRTEIAAVSVAGGALSAIGLNTAANMEEARVRLVGMTGSLQNANRLMEELRTKAKDAALPFNDVLTMATMLLPSLEGSTSELEKWMGLVKRVSVLNPMQGLEGAAFAVREAMASGGTDLMSLVERFQIERGKLRQALTETGGDFAAALDQVLTGMGVTNEVAEEMGHTFRRSLGMAKDSFQQLLGAGFAPMLESLSEILVSTAEWMNNLRETNPEMAKLVAGVAAFAAVGGPAILIAERLVNAFNALKIGAGLKWLLGLVAGGGGVALGVGATGAALGTGMGILASRGIGAVTGNEQMAQTDMSDVGDAVKNLPGNLRRELTALFPDRFSSKVTQADIDRTKMSDEERWKASGMEAVLGPMKTSTSVGGTGATKSRFTTGQTDVMVAWQQDLDEITRDAGEERLQEEATYGERRTEVVRSFGQQMAREEEDFARQRQRALEDLQRNIADLRENASRRDAQAVEDHNRKIAELREDHQKHILEIERDFANRRQDLLENHNDKLFEAASRLDAKAIVEENHRFATQMKQLDRDEKERTRKASEGNSERIDDEQESFDLRLRRSREADEERIRDMQEAFSEQQRLAEEDRAIRLQRMRDDHQAQLDEMAIAHGERMTEIDRQEAEAKNKRQLLFEEQLAEEGIKTGAFIRRQNEMREKAQDAFDKFWKHMIDEISGRGTEASGPQSNLLPTNPSVMQPFAKGGAVSGTTRALLHAGEYVLNPSVTESLRAMLGNFSQPELVRAVAGNAQASRNTSIRIAPGAIVVNEAQRPGMTAREIEGALLSIVRGIA